MTGFKSVNKVGYVKTPRSATGKYHISLNKGDRVQIKGECEGWSQVIFTKNEIEERGIYPTEFLQSDPIEKSVFKPLEASDPAQRLNNEILQVLKEWSTELLKLKQEKRRAEYFEVKMQVANLVALRKKIVDPKFKSLEPQERKEISDKILRLIEKGSRKLNLDLIVRVEKGENKGERATEKNTPIIDLYRLHRHIQVKEDDAKAKKLFRSNQKNEKSDSDLAEKEKYKLMRLRYDLPETSVVQLLLEVKACIFTVGEPTEVYFSVYCHEFQERITEEFKVDYTHQGMPKDERFMTSAIQTIFRDVKEKYYMRDLYLICRIFRKGKLVLDIDKVGTRKPSSHKEEGIRRPFGVAVLDLTPPIISEHLYTEARYTPSNTLPIYTHTNDLDANFHILHELVINHSRDITIVSDKIAIGVAVSVQMYQDNFDAIMDREENKVIKNASITPPLSFPDKIKVESKRNDFYITLLDGTFSNSQPVQILTRIYNQNIKSFTTSCISRDSTKYSEVQDSFMSNCVKVNKPNWNETIKINMEPKDLKESILVLVFYNSTSKKITGEPIGFGLLPLSKDKNLLISEGKHEITVYKYVKDLDKNIIDYMDPIKSKLIDLKNTMTISTMIISTEITDNDKLNGLLNWKNNLTTLQNILNELLYLQFPQTIQYIRITFDALFSIMTEKEEFQESTFLTLIQILDQFSKKQYILGRSVIQEYFDKHFNFSEIYKVLLKYSIQYLCLNEDTKKNKLISATLKNLKFLVISIIKSRKQFELKNENSIDEKEKKEFIENLKILLKNLNLILILEEKSIQAAQDISLKLLEDMFDYISILLNSNETGELVNSLIEIIPSNTGRRGLLEGKLSFMSYIAKSNIMSISEIRDSVLPNFVNQLINHFNQSIPETKLCISVLSNILSSIQDFIKYSEEEIKKMLNQISIILPHMCYSLNSLNEEKDQFEKKLKMTSDENEKLIIENDLLNLETLKGDLTSCFLCLFYYSDSNLFDIIRTNQNENEILNILNNILLLIIENPIPIYWISFNVFHYKTIITILNSISIDLLKNYSKLNDSFSLSILNSYFENLVQFIFSDRLELEKFSQSKQNKLTSEHGDMRITAVKIFCEIWDNLNELQTNFIPNIVSNVLRIANIPKEDIYIVALNIYYSILKREFKNTKSLKSIEGVTAVVLDDFIISGKLEDKFREFFVKILEERFSKDEEIYVEGTRFVNKINQVIQLISAVQKYKDEEEDEKTSALRKVMKYFKTTNSEDLYSKYIYSLARVHSTNKNYIEAAMTLLFVGNQLSFNSDKLVLKMFEYPEEKERERKEKLYLKCFDYFDLGRDWERGIKLSEELAEYYKTITYEYKKLSDILKKQGEYYEKIAKTKRFFSSYFFVAFFGNGFKDVGVKDKKYIYKANEAERLMDFITRIHTRFPNAEILKSSDPPSQEVIESDGQYIQILTVYPSSIRDYETKCGPPILKENVPGNIAAYDEFDQLNVFKISKTYRKHPKDKSIMEFRDLYTNFTFMFISTQEKEKSFPNIVRKIKIKETKEVVLNPVANALKNIEDKNVEFRALIISHELDSNPDTQRLSMLLNGVIDAAVNGGVQKYIDAYFVKEFLVENESEIENLKRFQSGLQVQLEVLKAGLAAYRKYGKITTLKHCEHLEGLYVKMKEQFSGIINFDLIECLNS